MDFKTLDDIDFEINQFDPGLGLEALKSKLDTLPKIDAKVPAIKKVPAHPCKVKRKIGNPKKLRIRSNDKITHVVIHSLGGGGNALTAVSNWKKGGGRNCSKPHYAVSRGGQIYQVVAEKFIPQASNQLNNSSIAVEHGYFKAKFPEKLYHSSSALVRDICDRYNIPKNREHILGHDEINQSGCRKNGKGECHGDPGGYWDWEYYMALVNWDGVDKNARPYRRILDSREARNVNTKAKKVHNQAKTRGNPLFFNSYGNSYYTITPSKTKETFCEYKVRTPVEGEYVISSWWPIKTGNKFNSSVTFKITSGTSTISRIVNQTTLRGTTRKTFALPFTPQWQELTKVNLKSGDIVRVQISRQSNKKGLIVADSIRLMCKKPKSQPFRPPDVCVENELIEVLSPLSHYESEETVSSGLLIADAPTPCAYYKIKPGDTLVGIAAQAYGKSKCARSFSCALKINNHSYNKQYWNPKLAGKVFKNGRISFSPRFSGRAEYPPKPIFQATKGKRFAVIYIPA